MSNSKYDKMIENRKKIEYCIKTCDDTELTEVGIDAVYDYVESFSEWAKSVGRISGPIPKLEEIRDANNAHNKLLNDIFDFSSCCEGSELESLTWEYLPKLIKASKVLVKKIEEITA